MGAIWGFFHIGAESVDSCVVDQMAQTLGYRGKGSTNYWNNRSVVLGQIGGNTQLPIVADARIDNRVELIRVLGLESAATVSDAALLFSAYRRWGTGFGVHIIGDFAIAIWDETKQHLICVRDPLGVKPLYYVRTDDLFLFATEIRTILASGMIPRRINETRVADFLLRNWEDKESTCYREVFRLSPAHTLTCNASRIETRRYWSFSERSRSACSDSPRDLVEQFRHLFITAVRDRIPAEGTIGSMLSGGLDSSSVTCVARDIVSRESKRTLHSFSGIFPNLPLALRDKVHEQSYIDAVIEQGRLIPHFIEGDQLSPFLDVETILNLFGEPIDTPNLYIHWAAYQQAKQENVCVMLDGLGGDEAISYGTERFEDLLRKGKWLELYREAHDYSERWNWLSPTKVIWRMAMKPHLPKSLMTLWKKNVRRNIATLPPFDAPIRAEFAQKTNAFERYFSFRKPEPFSVERIHIRMLESGIGPYCLEQADKIGAYHGLEARFPFFDRRLLEFTVLLPSALKLHNGWERYILREAMRGIVPNQITDRLSKGNLGPNFSHQFFSREQRRIKTALFTKADLIAPYADLEALRAMYRRCEEQPKLPHSLEQQVLYSATMLSLWLEKVAG